MMIILVLVTLLPIILSSFWASSPIHLTNCEIRSTLIHSLLLCYRPPVEDKPSPVNSANNVGVQRQVSSSEPLSQNELQPFRDPHRGLDESMRQMADTEW